MAKQMMKALIDDDDNYSSKADETELDGYIQDISDDPFGYLMISILQVRIVVF